MQISKIITKSAITVNLNGKTYVIPSSNETYRHLLEEFKSLKPNADNIMALVDKAAGLLKLGNEAARGVFSIRDGKVYVDTTEVHGALASTMLHYMENGLPFRPLVEFFLKAHKNPSERARNDLFGFLLHNNHPITDNGNFIAYKRVKQADENGKMFDIYSGKFDNSVGQRVSIPREDVDPDPNVTCSRGLHVANWRYAHNDYGNSSQPVLEVEVNPEHVVAIPTDYNQSKIRVSEYLVRSIAEFPMVSAVVQTQEIPAPKPAPVSEPSTVSDDEDDEDEEDDDGNYSFDDDDEDDDDEEPYCSGCEECDENDEEEEEEPMPKTERPRMSKMSTARLESFVKANRKDASMADRVAEARVLLKRRKRAAR